MPCYDDRDRFPNSERDAVSNDAKVHKAQAKLYKDRCDELARMLCKVCQQGPVTDPALASWWETHQAQDRLDAQIERMKGGRP